MYAAEEVEHDDFKHGWVGKTWAKALELALQELHQDFEIIDRWVDGYRGKSAIYLASALRRIQMNIYWLVSEKNSHAPPRSDCLYILGWDDDTLVRSIYDLLEKPGRFERMRKARRIVRSYYKTRQNQYAVKIDFELAGLPPLANISRYQHRFVSKKENDRWKAKVHEALKPLPIPDKPWKCTDLYLIRFSSREPDFDGLVHSFKPLVDALVEARVIVDDSPRHVERHYAWNPAPPKKGSVQIICKPRKEPIRFPQWLLDELEERAQSDEQRKKLGKLRKHEEKQAKKAAKAQGS